MRESCKNCRWGKKVPKQRPHRGECTHPLPAYLDEGQEKARFELPVAGFANCPCWEIGTVAPAPTSPARS